MHASYISMLLALIILFASTSSAYRIRSYLNEQQEEYFPSDAVKETIPLEENIILVKYFLMPLHRARDERMRRGWGSG
ncbi:unnamed protein product [Rotaria socialis]|uniref:Uncharacterized protein n=1 Tax=Rotaria socialis TaxID=392032 RepID=A0A818KNK1_9BILA|nr:unnamed protein product [Rotaria socialis]CAF3382985.1 unnamed protein product [Rotaria socialis]CAF3403585.1 unnamed protein product [Rotaria socialis]CAF3416477.1 unnamed protein product [Rotaria socialis]CAF3557219.1 unnamed protein product [Rotaria socialis]